MLGISKAPKHPTLRRQICRAEAGPWSITPILAFRMPGFEALVGKGLGQVLSARKT